MPKDDGKPAERVKREVGGCGQVEKPAYNSEKKRNAKPTNDLDKFHGEREPERTQQRSWLSLAAEKRAAFWFVVAAKATTIDAPVW